MTAKACFRLTGLKSEQKRKITDMYLANDDQLRYLIATIDNLIVKGRGVNLKKQKFLHEEKKCYISGQIIARVRLEKRGPGIKDSEKLARILWSEEAEDKILNLNNDEHLRILMGDVSSLIVNGRGVVLSQQVFISKERQWRAAGYSIGRKRFSKESSGIVESEKLAYILWPEKTNELLLKVRFDSTNDEHLRKLIGDVNELIVEGRGVNLRNCFFRNKEHDWNISGRTIGNACFGINHPGVAEAEKLIWRLWPKKAKEFLRKKRGNRM
ncbi:MAG: hypothetical protein ABFQ53_00100 [Patescibacteria group bacterium]